jgi:histidine triad (HIT) family protein
MLVMKDCVFCKIVKGELPVHKLYESADFLVILDRFPLVPGQTIVISKKHTAAYFAEMTDELLEKFVKMGKRMAKAMGKGLKLDRTTLVIEGLDVDHAHIKLFPVYSREEYSRSMKSKNQELNDIQLKNIADKIRREVDF